MEKSMLQNHIIAIKIFLIYICCAFLETDEEFFAHWLTQGVGQVFLMNIPHSFSFPITASLIYIYSLTAFFWLLKRDTSIFVISKLFLDLGET